MSRAFHFDAGACSGCKACQVACKDRHALPLGVLWRRVYEVSGGGWRREGEAWTQDVFAYNLSIGCNHCERPVCVEVCPTGAMHARADGIVLLDAARCVGCRYCEWACPYGAPQYDAVAGRMTKCTLCVDDLDRGQPPACVAACGLRSLTLVQRGAERGDPVGPLPPVALTLPSLQLAGRLRAGGTVANREEVRAGPAHADRSLVAFTLLGQLAAGIACALLIARFALPASARSASFPLLAAAALVAGLAAATSLLHLGSPARAWRALARVRTSPLSREVLALLLFGAVAGASAGLRSESLALLAPLPAALLLVAMARVYRLETVPSWNTPLTTLAFVLAALSAGAPAAALLVLSAGDVSAPALPPLLLLAGAASLLLELACEPAWGRVRRRAHAAVDAGLHPQLPATARLRPTLLALAAGLAAAAAQLAVHGGGAGAASPAFMMAGLAFLAAAAAAVLGRVEFFRSFRRLGL